jgi:hypothetical protein
MNRMAVRLPFDRCGRLLAHPYLTSARPFMNRLGASALRLSRPQEILTSELRDIAVLKQ